MPQRRILILTNRIPYPLNDGGNMAMHAMIQGYHDAGWQVHLLAMHTTRHPVPPEKLRELYTLIDGFETVDIDNRIKPIPTLVNLIFSRQPNHAARFFNIAFKEKLEQVINTFQPDAIQVESIFLAGYLPYIRQHSRALTILRMHNIEYQVWDRLAHQVSNLPKRRYLMNLAKRIRSFEEKAWKEFDLLLPITETDAAIAKSTGTKVPMLVAPFGIHRPHVSLESPKEEWNAYHIGAMDWLPNEEAIKWFLTDVWPRLHKEVPSFNFFFAGRNMSPQFRLNLPSAVHCMGEVPDADAFIADKKILIVPLRSGGGIRVKILEAMAKGKLVISTAIGMQGIEGIPGQHYLAANDAQSFIDAVKWALSNKDEASAIAQNAATLVFELYEQNVIMKNVIRQVDGLLNA